MLISNAHSENAGLSELIYNELTREGVLRKLLFMEYDNGETKLCLKMQKLKLEPLQVPIAYHWKLLKLLNSLVRSNDSIRTAFRGRLTQILKLK